MKKIDELKALLETYKVKGTESVIIGPVKLVPTYNPEYKEYVVKYYLNGKYDDDKSYFTNDKEDMISTMASMKADAEKQHGKKD